MSGVNAGFVLAVGKSHLCRFAVKSVVRKTMHGAVLSEIGTQRTVGVFNAESRRETVTHCDVRNALARQLGQRVANDWCEINGGLEILSSQEIRKTPEYRMSENKPGWASMRSVADMLTTVDNVASIEFYVHKRDNSPAELNCRCFGLPGMSKAEIEALAERLNAAISPVKNTLEATLQNKAANQLRRFL